VDGTIELAPIRRGVSHQTDALQVVQCAAAMAIKHVTAAVHLGSVESNFPPVILPIAMEKNAVRSFQAGHGTVQAIMSPLWPPNTQPLTLARTPANVRQSRRTGCMDFRGSRARERQAAWTQSAKGRSATDMPFRASLLAQRLPAKLRGIELVALLSAGLAL